MEFYHNTPLWPNFILSEEVACFVSLQKNPISPLSAFCVFHAYVYVCLQLSYMYYITI